MLLRIWLISAIAIQGLTSPLSVCCGSFKASEVFRVCCGSTAKGCCGRSAVEQVVECCESERLDEIPARCEPSLACSLCVVLCGSSGFDPMPMPERSSFSKIFSGPDIGEALPPPIPPAHELVAAAPREMALLWHSALERRSHLCIWLN